MARERRAGFVFWVILLQSGRAARSQERPDRERGFSLQPPSLNIAQGAEIWATATCGEDGSGRPRLDLYCKLVGGPAAGSSSHTIQVPELQRVPASPPRWREGCGGSCRSWGRLAGAQRAECPRSCLRASRQSSDVSAK
ncbi:laminin subunit alpha-3-like [Narcine bancroftii]|uniref:laminin subunit alpha-3-like n=1 Tax=Narcine bancroftii TaxID=1343680 RepID=UPI0038310169